MFNNYFRDSLDQAKYRQQELLREAAHARLLAELRQKPSGSGERRAKGGFLYTLRSLVVPRQRPTQNNAELCCAAG